MKLLTYLAPSIPLEFYQALVEEWSSELGEPGEAVAEWSRSGPTLDQLCRHQDPFSTQEIDVAAMCAPTYVWASDQDPPRVGLLPLLPLFVEGEAPEYSSLVVVKQESSFRDLQGLEHATWCYNDDCSLSGYYSVLDHFQGRKPRLKSPSGGHYQSMQWVAEGQADACAVDSNGWVFLCAQEPELAARLRVVGELGPYPAQPFVVSTKHSEQRRQEIAGALFRISEKPEFLERLREDFSFHHFVKVGDHHFKGIRTLMDHLGVRTDSSS